MARKWLTRLAFGLISLSALYFIALYAVGGVADERLEAELTAIREKGEPLLLAEMAPPPVPDEQNAAIPFGRAAELLLEPEADEEQEAMDGLLENPDGIADEAAEIMREWVDRHRATYAAIEDGLSRSGCRFDYDYSSAETILEPSHPWAFEIVRFGRLLAVRGILGARAGETGEAYDDAVRVLRLARLMSLDPQLVHAIVRIVCEGRALTVIQAAMHREPPDPERRTDVIASLDSIDVRGNLRHALFGERCFGRSMFDAFLDNRDLGGALGPVGALEGGLEAMLLQAAPTPVIRLDQAHYLNLMARKIELSSRPAHQTREGWDAFQREGQDPPWYALLSGNTLIHMQRMYVQAEAHRARLDMARIALDLEHALAVTGSLPDTILSPGAGNHRGVIDPFSGKNYRYRTTEDGGYVIWSIGPDFKDDQGRDGAEENYDSGDVVWKR